MEILKPHFLMVEEWDFSFLKGGNESRIGKNDFVTKI
jgi:hypothetical protein